MPDEEVKPTEASKPVEDIKPPEEQPPQAEPVIVETQKEVNPLEARLEAMEKRLNERDEKEKIAAEKAKEVKHEQAADGRPLAGEKKITGGGKDGGGDKPGATVKPPDKPEPVGKSHRFKFRRKPVK